jgi:hypothetical protein
MRNLLQVLRDHTGVSIEIKRSMFWSHIAVLILFVYGSIRSPND